MLKLTAWMNVPSFYQDDLFRAVNATGEVDLEVVYVRDVEEERKRLGWRREPGGYPFRRLSPRWSIAEAVRLARSQKDRLHFVNGIWGEPVLVPVLLTLGAQGSRFVIYTEASEPGGNRGLAKRTLRRSLGGWVARRASGAFPVARLGEDFLEDLGFRPDNFFPFGYFRRATAAPGATEFVRNTDECEIVYVGQLIQRKGIDLLLDSLKNLAATGARPQLKLIGDGPARSELEGLVEAAGLSRQVTFVGPLPYDEIMQRIATADLLVLPSRWDGWGLVANEAFSVGVPVMASDRCGASDLIRDGVNGYVFRSDDAADLQQRLSSFLDLGAGRAAMRAAALETGRSVDIETIAQYFVACLNTLQHGAPKPTPPWRLLETSLSER